MDSPATTPPAAGRERWLAAGGLLLLFVVLIGLFLPAMRSPLAFDDNFSIKQIKDFESWTDAFDKDAFSFFRPIKNLFFYGLAAVDNEPIYGHIGTVGAYLLATAGVFTLATRLIGRSLWGLAVAAIWSLSAAHVTIAIWASCFNISIAAAAMAFGLAAWDRWREQPDKWRFAIAFFALLSLGLLSYETAIATAPLAVLIDLFRGRRLISKASLARYSGIALVIGVWLVVRHDADAKSGELINPSFSSDAESWQISASAPYFLWTHFLMWLAPWDRLECLGSYIWGQSIPVAIIPFCWTFLIGIAVLAIRFWKPGNLVVFGLAWFFVAAFPSGNFIPLGNTPYADYYVPIPAIGLSFLFVALMRGLLKLSRQTHIEPNARVAAQTIIVLLVAARVANLSEFRHWVIAWKNPIEVMAETTAVRPYQYLAKDALSQFFLEVDRLDLAQKMAEASIADLDDLASPHITLGCIYIRQEKLELAKTTLETALERRHLSQDSLLYTRFRLGEVIAHDPERIQEVYEFYLLPILRQRNHQNHVDAILVTANAFHHAGRNEDEIDTLEKGSGYYPDNTAIKSALEDANQRQAANNGES